MVALAHSYVPGLSETLLATVASYGVAWIIRNRVSVLSRYCIPVAFIAGLLLVVALRLGERLFGVGIVLSDAVQPVVMAAFFASIGLLVSVKGIFRGSIRLVWFLLACGGLIVLQDGLGMALAGAFGLQKHYGLLVGSVSMMGGVGTAAAFGPYFEKTYAVAGASMIGLIAAAIGMLVSLLVGPMLGRWLIRRDRLENDTGVLAHAVDLPNPQDDAQKGKLDPKSWLLALAAVAFCVFLALKLSASLAGFVRVPGFIFALVLGILCRALADFIERLPVEMRACESLVSICLSYLLAMAFYGIDWEILQQVSLPLAAILLAQVLITVLFALIAIYRGFGRNYESMMLCVGLVGFGIGATATALAGMFAIGERFGHCERAIVMVSLTGGLLIDFMNASLIVGFAML